MKGRVLFLTLKVFSATGGIEKVCRVAGKALAELAEKEGSELSVYSMYDATGDAAGNNYFPASLFRGFSKAKMAFMLAAVSAGKKSDTVLLSHINLLPAAWLIKKLSPSTKVVLLAHGIEIWGPLSFIKKRSLKACDEIWAVSRHTREVIIARHAIAASGCKVLNNCLDPFLPQPLKEKDNTLLDKYGLNKSDLVMLTLTRLSATERYKNYDKIIGIVAELQQQFPDLKYLLAGKCDATEEAFLKQLIKSYGLQNSVILTGFIPEDEMAAYFSLADLYIMPSKKEGFGITFIEAMYYGLPVIAGNKDGSIDALLDGRLGTLVDPDNVQEMKAAIEQIVSATKNYTPDAALLTASFSFETYKNNISRLLKSTLQLN